MINQIPRFFCITAVCWMLCQPSVGVAEEHVAPWMQNVEIYGKIQASAEILDDGARLSGVVSSNSSRIGFKGGEELPYGLELIWQYEGGIVINTAGGDFETRNSFIGVRSGIGYIFVGRHDTPFERLSRDIDMFDERLGDSRNIIGSGGAGFNQRSDHIIGYQSPNLTGFRTFVLYRTENGADETDLLGLNITYENGGLWLGAGYEQHGKMLTGSDTNADGVIDTASDEAEDGLRVVGSYTLEDLRVVGLYESLFDVGGVSGADRASWGGSLAYTLGQHTIRGTYYATRGIDDATDASANMVGVAIDHALTDATVLYVAFAITSNESGSALPMSGGGHGTHILPAAGDDPYGVAIGINHTF